MHDLDDASLPLGQISGIQIKLNITVFFLIFFSGFYQFNLYLAIVSFLLSILIIFTHEIGHMIVAQRLHYEVYSITIHFWGGHCNHEPCDKALHEILISWAGIFFQFLILIAFLIINPLIRFPVVESSLIDSILEYRFVRWNLILIAINLIPVPPLDGYMAWKIIPFVRRKLKKQFGKRKKNVKVSLPKMKPEERKAVALNIMNQAIEIARKEYATDQMNEEKPAEKGGN